MGSGLYALWTKVCDVKVEVVDAGDVRFNHKDLNIIAKSDGVEKELIISNVEQGFAGVKTSLPINRIDVGRFDRGELVFEPSVI